MKVVEGNFREEDDSRSPGEILAGHLENSGFNELTACKFLLLGDTEESLMMLSNLYEPEQVLMMLEKARMALMTTVFDATP